LNACVLNEYNKFSWMEVKKPEIRNDEVLIQTTFASICGSDQHIFSGEFHPRTKLPLIPGHEFTGKVVETGTSIKEFTAGDRVAVDPILWCGKCPACQIGHYPACTSLKLLGVDLNGGFGEYVVAKPHMLYKLTENITDQQGALVEVLGIGFHACNRAGIKKGDAVAIWGTGKVGHCILQAVRTRTDGPVFLIDLIDERLKRAKNGYPDVFTVNPLREDPVKAVMENTQERGVDVAFEAVGHDTSGGAVINPVRGCIQLIRGAGKVCVLGLGDDPAPIRFKELIWKEATIVASRVSHGEFGEVIRQMDRGNLKPDLLISDVFQADHVQKAFEMLKNSPEKHLKILLSFQD
jgi:threonine dehydrogenase-like Zn-dependent dehydrogenase